MVKFALDFAADDENGSDAFDALIRTIRAKLAVGEDIEGVPILAPQVPAGGTLEFFDVNLSYTDRGTTYTVQARFRTDNLYLVRYRPANANDWQELDGRENYNTLTRAAGMELDEIPLSASRIGAAIMTLADNNAGMRPRAHALLTVMFAIAEAARFRDISSLISRSWWSESTPGVHFANRVRSWGRLSSAVQRTRNEGHTFDFDGESTDIWAFVAAIQALGIMLLTTSSRPKRATADMAAASQYTFARGQPLLEIFSVRINSFDGGEPGQLYGTITVTDSAGAGPIWERDKANCIEIWPGDKILLGTGPSGPLSAADEFYIQLDLLDHHAGSSDDSIAKGTIAFNPRDSFTQYNSVQSREVTGQHGSVTVGYVAITDGLYAQVTVIMLDGNCKDPAAVYGEITAKNGLGQSELFRKTSSQNVDVRPRHEIPLSRTVVAVPTTGTLKVDANLWDHDATNGGDEIAYGSVEFEPLYRQSEEKTITGENGIVEVRVTWM